MARTTALAIVLLMPVIVAPRPEAQQKPAAVPASTFALETVALAPTNHRLLPRDVSRLWFAPIGKSAAHPADAAFIAAMALIDQGAYAKALPLLSKPEMQGGPLGEYAQYYAGVAALRLNRATEARHTFRALQERQPIGYLAEAAALGEADAAEAEDDLRGAVAIYEKLATTRTAAPDHVLMRLGSAAKIAGDRTRAAEAFGRVYFEFPTSDLAAAAGAEYDALPNVQPLAVRTERYKLELGRAERLFGARRYADARNAFQRLRSLAEGDDRELAQLRLAESDYFLKRYRSARDGVQPYIGRASRRAEALYFYAVSTRELGNHAEYLKTVRQIADEFPTESWAEEALNNLATHYVLLDDDVAADSVFRELYAKYPKSRYADRAAWKAGWRAYRERRFAETTHFFEHAAADFPRSDYRPSWLYWSGRAREALNETSLARERYGLVATDYLNSYYGRLAVKRLGGPTAPRVFGEDPAGVPPPDNEPLVRTLLRVKRYEEALNELKYAQRTWRDSAPIQATIAWIYQQQGLAETGNDRFTLLRGSITVMRRAYPQFMAAGGEGLPRDVQTVIFPIAYWELIRKYSTQHGLDEYLVAALVAQESTFVPDVRSSANAYGLMQLLPATGRRYARALRLGAFSMRMLTTAEPNLRMGTAYFADLMRQFGQPHYALAGYNAGPHRVKTWREERPGLIDQDEFIDDIPFPETQNYVKRILGTAEDYRRLYGPRRSGTSH